MSGDATNWFGVVCRNHGLGNDVYLATFSPDGSWAIYRTTLGGGNGQRYVRRALDGGSAPDFNGVVQPPDFVFRIRLECTGLSPTTLRLFLNEREVGRVDDPSGLGPANVGIAGASRDGELVFDNPVVTALN